MKKYNVIYYVLSIIAVINMTRCDTNLDEKVFSEITEVSYNYKPDDWNASIAGVYYNARGSNDRFTFNVFYHTQELTAPCLGLFPNVSGWNDGGIYLALHFHSWNSELASINTMWNNFWGGVVLCNSALERIEKGIIPSPSESAKNTALAEIRTVRAYYYWRICDNYGDAPLVTTLTQELPEKVSRTEIYDFIVKELNDAIPYLKEEVNRTTYGTFHKWAAKCLLANIYLNAEVYTGTARWNECIKECDDIINSGKCELSSEYKNSFRTTGVEDSKEVLFALVFDNVQRVTGNAVWVQSWHRELRKKYLTNATPNEAGGAKAIGQFIDTYQEGDGRLDDTWLHGLQYDYEGNLLTGLYDMPGQPLNFTKDLPSAYFTNEMEGYRMNKYEVEVGAETNSNTDLPMFRYAEVLLMKAECLLRTGNPGAGALVTQVRQRNFKDDPSKAIVTDEQLKDDSSYPWGYIENYNIVDPGNQDPVQFGRLYDEWNWEFAYEFRARQIAIRFGVFTTKSWLSHKPQGAHRTVFPIPERAITSNPKLMQNPAYL